MLYMVRRLGKSKVSILDSDDMKAEIVSVDKLVELMASNPYFNIDNMTPEGDVILMDNKILKHTASNAQLTRYNCMVQLKQNPTQMIGEKFGYAVFMNVKRLLLWNRGYLWEAKMSMSDGYIMSLSFLSDKSLTSHRDMWVEPEDIIIYEEGNSVILQDNGSVLRFRDNNMVESFNTPHCDFERTRGSVVLLRYGVPMDRDTFVKYVSNYSTRYRRKKLFK